MWSALIEVITFAASINSIGAAGIKIERTESLDAEYSKQFVSYTFHTFSIGHTLVTTKVPGGKILLVRNRYGSHAYGSKLLG